MCPFIACICCPGWHAPPIIGFHVCAHWSNRLSPPAGAAQIEVTYPSLAAMVAYIQSRHTVLKQVASTARGSLDMTKPLPLPHKAYLALITFLRQCRSKQAEQAEAPQQDYLGTAMI